MRTLVLAFLLVPIFSNAQEKSKMEIYPNPVTDIVTIKVGEHTDPAKVKIISESGQEVWSEYKSESEFSLNLELYPKGVYYVQIAIKDRVEVCKFIKR